MKHIILKQLRIFFEFDASHTPETTSAIPGMRHTEDLARVDSIENRIFYS